MVVVSEALVLAPCDRADLDAQVRIDSADFLEGVTGDGRRQLLDDGSRTGRDGDCRARLAGDRVVLVPPLDTNQPHRTASECASEQLGEDLDRVAAVLVNGQSRMAAFEAGDIDFQLGPALRAGAGRQVEDQIGRATAGTAYEQRPVFLGIQVEQCPAREQAPLEVRRPRQGRLLVHGEEQLKGAVGDGRVVGDRLRGRHPDAVVRAERGPRRDDPVAFDDDLDRVLEEVEVGGFVLLGDHVHVALEDDGGGLLSALGAGHIDHEVADGVAAMRQAARLGPGAQVRHRGCLVA